MTRLRIISNKDELCDVEQATISSAAIANQLRWELNAAWMTGEFIPKKNRWDEAYTVYKPVNTRTPLITFEKNESRKAYEPTLRRLIDILQSNVIVTDDERKAMGIYIAPHHSSHNPIPADMVAFEVDSSVIRCLKIKYYRAGSKSRGKSHTDHGAEMRYAILDHPPTSIDELVHSAFSTRSPFVMEFDESQRGKIFYFCIRWENTTGEKGEFSEIGSAYIP
ncbi:MAG: hypothetical protein LBC40_06930 [Dysgonamonadaceae bacterium]|jgi:hypothetical protein|nr:hypothetical protein [Dysgonamonadaceae bacterium]